MTTDFSNIQTFDVNIQNVDLQPLTWRFKEIPMCFRKVWAVKISESTIRLMDEANKLSRSQKKFPIKYFQLGILNLFPDSLCPIPYAFEINPSYRAPYWLICKSEIDTKRLARLFKYWLLLYDKSNQISELLVKYPIKFESVQLDLQQALETVQEKSLPHLIAHWLVDQQFQYTLLSDQQGISKLKVYHSVSDNYGSGTSELITEPVFLGKNKYPVSYFLHFRSEKNHEKGFNVYFKIGVRRWMYKPFLVYGNKKSVYFPLNGNRFFKLMLEKVDSKIIWSSKLHELMEFMSDISIPTPEEILANPKIAYVPADSTTYHVEKGVELRDRAQAFEDILNILPGATKEEVWKKVWKSRSIPKRNDNLQKKKYNLFTDQIRKEALQKMGLPVTIHILSYSSDAIQNLEEDIREQLGHPPSNELKIEININPRLTGLLDSDHGHKKRKIQIEREIKPNINKNKGFLIILNENFSKSPERANKDPYPVIRQSLARLGYVSQFIIHDEESSSNSDRYNHQCSNAIRDLLRQMEFQAGSLYGSYEKTSLSDSIDIIGLYQLKSGKLSIPSVNIIRSIDDKWEIRMPGKKMLSYRECNLHIATTKENVPEKLSKQYYSDQLREFLSFYPTLLIVDEQNISRVFSEFRKRNLVLKDGKLINSINLFPNQDQVRIAIVRKGFEAGVPWFYPVQSMRNRNNGLFRDQNYENVFYSFQEKNSTITKGITTKGTQVDRYNKLTWIQNALEIVLLNLQPEDRPEEWALIIHDLRHGSSHTDEATKLPEPLHSMEKSREYINKLNI